MAFLPEGYQEPVTSNYMAFVAGENTFRILSDATIGWEYWKTLQKDGKDVRGPVRIKGTVLQPMKITEFEINPKTGNLDTPSRFWAFAVYNRQANRIQILEIKQGSIRKSIQALFTNKAWGDVKKYDITVTREGQGLETRYSVLPCPKEELDKSIIKQYEDSHINLDSLFANDGTGADPFKTDAESVFMSKKEVEEQNDKVPF